MAGKGAPINVEVLDWALGNSGLSKDEFIVLAKLTPERLTEIRSGAETLTGELNRIAGALKRPPAFFFLSAPPDRPPIAALFRHPSGRPEDRPLNSREVVALRSAARWQQIAGWIQSHQPVDRPELPVVSGGSPNSAAKQLIGWLSWSLTEQRQAQSPNRLLGALRSRLEDHGVLVLQYSLGRESCKGFAIPHDSAPVVALNTAYNAPARVYSLLHECAHLVRRDRAVCGARRDDQVERWCERTAAIFLMPADDLRQYLAERGISGKVDNVDVVRRVANRYHVSLRAAAVRLEELGRAAPGLYDTVDHIAEFDSTGFGRGEPQTTPVIRLRSLGAEMPRLLLGALDAGLLSDTAVRRLLDVDGSQLQYLRERVASSVAEV